MADHHFHIRGFASILDCEEAIRVIARHSLGKREEFEVVPYTYPGTRRYYTVEFRKDIPKPEKGPSIRERQPKIANFLSGYCAALGGKIRRKVKKSR